MFLPSVTERQDPVQLGFKVGEELGFKGADANELVAFLRTKTPEELLNAINKIKESLRAVSAFIFIRFQRSSSCELRVSFRRHRRHHPI